MQQNTASTKKNTADIAEHTKVIAEKDAEMNELRSELRMLLARLDHLEKNSATPLPGLVIEQLTRTRIELSHQSTCIVNAAGSAVWQSYTGPTGLPVTANIPGAARAPSTPATTPAGDGGNAEPSMAVSDKAAPAAATRPGTTSAPMPQRSAASTRHGADDNQEPADLHHGQHVGPEDSVGAGAGAGEGEAVTPPKLREYQRFILDGVLAWWAEAPRHPDAPDVAAVVLPTGAGKTSIAFEVLLHAARQPGYRTAVFLAPTVALVEQQAQRFVRRRDVVNINATVWLVAGRPARTISGIGGGGGPQVVFATPQSYNQWDQRPGIDPVSVLVLDESHHAKLSTRTNHPCQVALDESGPGTKVVGLSATPEAFLERDPRIFTVAAGQRGLVGNQVEEVHINIVDVFPAKGRLLCDHLLELEAIRKGAQQIDDVDRLRLAVAAQRLYRNVGWGAVAADLNSKGADSCALKLSSKPLRRSPVVDAVIAVLHDAMGRATDRQPQVIVYCDHIESAKLLTEMLKRLGDPTGPPELAWVRPALVTGKTSKADMMQVLDDFHPTNVTVLVATSCVREGIDVPGCNLVIAVEPPNCNLDNIQIKGRARAVRSKYVVITVGSVEKSSFANVIADTPTFRPSDSPDAAHDHPDHRHGIAAVLTLARPPAAARSATERPQHGRPNSGSAAGSWEPAISGGGDGGVGLSGVVHDVPSLTRGVSPGAAIHPPAPSARPSAPSAANPRGHQRPPQQRRNQTADPDLELAMALSLSESEHRRPAAAATAVVPSPPRANGVAAEGAFDKAGAWETKERIVRTLLAASRPLTALELSKAVGLTTAKDVNRHIYALETEGQVETLSKSGRKPCWSLVL